MTVKYGSGTSIHIIGTQILAAHENTPTTPPPPALPQNKYHSKCHASCMRRSVSCKSQMLLAEKESSMSMITTNKKDKPRFADAGVR
jgi:hypothetical protein